MACDRSQIAAITSSMSVRNTVIIAASERKEESEPGSALTVGEDADKD